MPPANTITGTPAALGPARNPAWPLVAQTLLIEQPFGRDHQVGSAQRLIEAHQLQHQIDPGFESRSEQSEQAGCDAAGGTARNQFAHVATCGSRDHRREMREVLLELQHGPRGCALLWTEQPGRSVRTEQGTIHVTGDPAAALARAPDARAPSRCAKAAPSPRRRSRSARRSRRAIPLRARPAGPRHHRPSRCRRPPKITVSTPASRAALINLPVPRLLTNSGSCSCDSNSATPEAVATSSTAVRPWSSKPKLARTGRPSGSGTTVSRVTPSRAARSTAPRPHRRRPRLAG